MTMAPPPVELVFDRARILSVEPDGIHYQGDDGHDLFIDLRALLADPANRYRYVGYRNIHGAPPYFKFSTRPPTLILFPDVEHPDPERASQARDEWVWFEDQLRRAGYVTIDMT
jgi:hypothetical protein